MEIFWEMRQQKDIVGARQDASSAKNKADRMEFELSALSRKVERLSLASQALWELLRDHTDFQEEHILAKMQEIDLRDGKADGRIGQTAVVCPQCGRQGSSVRTGCLYCGTEIPRHHVFE